MDLDILDKKIRRLACKLKKYEVNLEIFEHESIEYGPLLGQGGESVVRSCTVVYNGIPIDGAAKTLLDCSDDAISITLDEIEMLCLARDPIVTTTLQVYGVAAVPEETDPEMGHLVIITEAGIMNGLQLYQREEVPAFVTYDLWSRVAAAIHCMHLKKIIHQDLKPENVLVTGVVRDSVGQICKVDFKIIDLGMAKRVINEKVITDDIVGTNGYHAPEVLFDDTYDYKADIFQLGISFCVMLHSSDFLKGNALQEFLQDLHTAKHENQTGKVLFEKVIAPTLPENLDLSPRIRNMLIKMLEKQEKRTIPLLEIVEMCREESENRREATSNLPPILSPYMAHNSPDSGIGGGAGHGGSSKKRTKRKASTSSRRRSTRRSDRSTASNVSVSSSVENHAPDSTSSPARRTRAMKRATSVFLQAHGNPHCDPNETPPPAKRTRSCTSMWR